MRNHEFIAVGFLFCLFFALLSPLQAQQAASQGPTGRTDSDIERLVVGLENQILQGYVQGNREAVAPLLASDFQDVGEYGVWDKQRSLQDITDPTSVTKSSTMRQVRFSRLAPTVVLLTYRLDEI